MIKVDSQIRHLAEIFMVKPTAIINLLYISIQDMEEQTLGHHFMVHMKRN